MKKKVLVLLFILALASHAIAESLYTLRSEHFEFIYPEESEETAIILYENAEALYEKATSLLQADLDLFFPVYITPNTQQLNAYFTAAPYNRIVFYDTPADSFSLAVFSNTKLLVFYHELVHGLTMNMKNGFWNFLSTLFGDVYSPSYLYTSTLSFLEGATVSFESMDGEGRLNNGDSLAYIVQAKLEDVFPSWKDASGPRDVFPKTQYAYIFGGAFNSYIQKKYGMEKYSELWKLCGSGGGWNPFIDGSFKKVYGVSLEEEWNAFAETIPVPVLADDVDISTVAEKPSYHSAMAFRNGAEKGIAFLENSSFIRYAPIDPDTGLPEKVRTLLLGDGYISDMSFTEDGRYLLINGIGTNLANTYSLKIYDMEQDEYVAKEVYPLSYACIADFAGYGKFVVGVAVRSGRAYLEIRDFNEVLAQGNDAAVLYSAKFPVLREVYGLCAAGGKVWSLEKENGLWSVVAYEFCVEDNRCSLERQKSYDFPYGIVPSSFTYGGTNGETHTFYFAVAGKGLSAGFEEEPGTLSRLLVMEIPESSPENTSSQNKNGPVHTEPLELPVGNGVKHGEHFELYPVVATSVLPVVFEPASVSIAKGDVSGGVHRPFYDASTDTLYFIARKAESIDVSFCHGIPGGLFELNPIYAKFVENPQETENPQEISEPEPEKPTFLTERGSYNPLRYVFKGAFIPAGMDLTTDYAYLLGATWMLVDPTESFKALISSGWDYFNGKVGASIRTWGGPSFLSYELSFLSEWSRFGFKSLRGKCVLSGAIPVNTRRQEIQYADKFIYEYDNDCHNFTNKAGIAYASDFKTGKGYFDKLSFTAGATFVTESFINSNSSYEIRNNLGLFVNGGIGGFLPITVNASLIPDSKHFLDLSAEAVLLSFEIQNGIPLLPLYANRFTLTGGYRANWKDSPRNMMIIDFPDLISDLSSFNVKHGVTCGLNFTLSPIMSLMYSFQFKFGADFTWYFGNEQDNKLYDLVLCGVFTF